MTEAKTQQTKWLAIYTRPKFEKKITQQLARIDVEHYCPFTKVIRQWSDRKKIIEVPLFTSYVFVKITDHEQHKIREVDGVVNFVYWLGKPAVIKDAEIAIIQMFLRDYVNVKVEKKLIKVNDRVRITSGPLLFQEGIVTNVMNKTIKVDLPSLGYEMVAQVEKEHVEVIKTGSPI
jgi:transcription antitermination factor NusG